MGSGAGWLRVLLPGQHLRDFFLLENVATRGLSAVKGLAPGQLRSEEEAGS